MANDTPRGLHVRAFEYPNGYAGNFHSHRLGQIVYPVRGIVSVETETGSITVSPYRAISIPSWVKHRVASNGNTSLRSIYLDPLDNDVPQAIAAVVNISPLLHELIREAGQYYGDVVNGTIPDQILKLIVTLLFQSKAANGFIEVPRITHPRLIRAFDRSAQPKTGQVDALLQLSSNELAEQLALGPRQFRRIFKQHVGITFTAWRTLAKVNRAAEKIAFGQSITTVAAELSFSSSSALSEVFKRHTGLTPTQFSLLQRHPQHS